MTKYCLMHHEMLPLCRAVFGACVQLQNPGLTIAPGNDAFEKAWAHAPL